jgi:hypothetical protein
MSQKNIVNGNNAIKTEDDATRVTSARSFYRMTAPVKPQKISLVAAIRTDGLLSKEEDCCSRATD